MNNEPVAWTDEDFEELMTPELMQKHKDINSSTWKHFTIPLYTHPADLTDEEIKEIISECTMTKFVWNQPLQEFDAIGFAKAILRKAQEK